MIGVETWPPQAVALCCGSFTIRVGFFHFPFLPAHCVVKKYFSSQWLEEFAYMSYVKLDSGNHEVTIEVYIENIIIIVKLFDKLELGSNVCLPF